MLGAGPVLCIRLSKNYFYSADFKEADIALNAFAGYEWPIGFSINGNYTYGLVNMSNHNEFLSSYKNRYAAFTVGYRF